MKKLINWNPLQFVLPPSFKLHHSTSNIITYSYLFYLHLWFYPYNAASDWLDIFLHPGILFKLLVIVHTYYSIVFYDVLCVASELLPVINTLTVDDICSDSFTVSWTSTSNETEISYNVMLSPPSQSLTTMNNYNNFTGLTPNTNYSVTVVASSSLGSGVPMAIVVTTLTVEEERPMGKMWYNWYMPMFIQCQDSRVPIDVQQTTTQCL